MNCKVVLLIVFAYGAFCSCGEITQSNGTQTNNVGTAKTKMSDDENRVKSAEEELAASTGWTWYTANAGFSDELKDMVFEWPRKGFKYQLKDSRAIVVYSTPTYAVVKELGGGERRYIVFTKLLYADGEPIQTGWYGCLGKRRVGERVRYVFREL